MGKAKQHRHQVQDDQRQSRTEQTGCLVPQANGDANRRGQPDTGGSGQALDLIGCVALEDGAVVVLVLVVVLVPAPRKPTPATTP